MVFRSTLVCGVYINVNTCALIQVCTVDESVNIKGGVWDAGGCFVYATSTHVKHVDLSGYVTLIVRCSFPVQFLWNAVRDE